MIIVIMDRLYKGVHITLVREVMTASELAKAFMREIRQHHGLPDSIVYNRGRIFISEF